jgi:deoxyxylulose-5-phosphate synthase
MLNGGLSSLIVEYYNDNQMKVNLYRFGIDDEYVPHGSNVELKKALKLDTTSVLENIQSIVG